MKYPNVESIQGNQGVGPHFDGGFLTFVNTKIIHCLDMLIDNAL